MLSKNIKKHLIKNLHWYFRTRAVSTCYFKMFPSWRFTGVNNYVIIAQMVLYNSTLYLSPVFFGKINILSLLFSHNRAELLSLMKFRDNAVRNNSMQIYRNDSRWVILTNTHKHVQYTQHFQAKSHNAGRLLLKVLDMKPTSSMYCLFNSNCNVLVSIGRFPW